MSDPMKNYEVTFIVDPVLSGEEQKATAQTYVDLLKSEDCKIVHVDEMGLRQLAYAINRRTSGVYYCIEFETPSGAIIAKMELAMRRDERIMRYLTAALDKYGVKYNADKRAGLIGKVSKKKGKSDNDKRDRDRDRKRGNDKGGKPKSAAKDSKPAPKPKQESKPKADTKTAVAEEEE